MSYSIGHDGVGQELHDLDGRRGLFVSIDGNDTLKVLTPEFQPYDWSRFVSDPATVAALTEKVYR